MAEVTLTAIYECPLDLDEADAPFVPRAIRVMDEEAAKASRDPNADVTTRLQMQSLTKGGRLRWEVAEKFDAELVRAWDADSVGHKIDRAAAEFEDEADTIISRSVTDVLIHSVSEPMRKALQARTPLQALARIPLRHGDREAIGDSPLAFLMAALRRPHPFSIDLVRDLEGMTAEVQGQYLVIIGMSVHAVGSAAAAFVRAPRPITVVTSRHPYWAYGAAAILATSFVLSWLPLTTGSVVALATATVAIAGAALLFARRHSLIGRTALGLVPVLILIAFAIAYSIAGLTDTMLGLGDGEMLHMRDALLLSLSLASTVGVLDLQVGGWLRSVAYLEMLLVAGSVGAAALIAVRSLSSRLDRMVGELRLERESANRAQTRRGPAPG